MSHPVSRMQSKQVEFHKTILTLYLTCMLSTYFNDNASTARRRALFSLLTGPRDRALHANLTARASSAPITNLAHKNSRPLKLSHTLVITCTESS